MGGGVRDWARGRFQIFCANESRQGGGGGEVIGGGIEMQLFKTAITEMKERGLNRGRPPGARGIYSTGFPSWKNSLKAFLPGRRAAMQTKNQTWSLAVLFLLVLFILRVSSCWVQSRACANTNAFFPNLSPVSFPKFDGEGRIDEKFARIYIILNGTNPFRPTNLPTIAEKVFEMIRSYSFLFFLTILSSLSFR